MVDHLPTPDPESDADPARDVSFTCPRCGSAVTARYWGPCATCRDELAAKLAREPTIVDVAPYEPTMHVIPNQVATKE